MKALIVDDDRVLAVRHVGALTLDASRREFRINPGLGYGLTSPD